METGLIYALGRYFGHRCVSLSVVLANRANDQFSKYPVAAMESAIDSVLSCMLVG